MWKTPFSINRGSATILRPLGWMAWLGAGAVITALRYNSQQWVLLSILIPWGLTVLLYLVAFAYCLFTDKEALRTEDYTLKRIAIQRCDQRP